MLVGIKVVIGWMAFVTLFGFAMLAWGLHAGQLDDVESTKYIPFEEKDPIGWNDESSPKREA